MKTGTNWNQDGKSGRESAMTFTANNAPNECRPVETAAGDTVAMPVSRGQRGNGNGGSAPPVDTVSVTATERLPIPNVSAGALRPCDHCGEPYRAVKAWSRYCGPRCRRLAWLERNPEKAALLAERDRARYRARLESRGVAVYE